MYIVWSLPVDRRAGFPERAPDAEESRSMSNQLIVNSEPTLAGLLLRKLN